MKQCARITAVSMYTFEGSWFHPKLTEVQTRALNLNKSPEEIIVIGEYHVEWEGEHPEVYVDTVLIYDEHGDFIIITDQIDYSDLAHQIFAHANHSDWLTDKYHRQKEAA